VLNVSPACASGLDLGRAAAVEAGYRGSAHFACAIERDRQPIMSLMSEEERRPRGVAGVIWMLEHAQDVISVIVGVLLVALAAVVLALGVGDFSRDITGNGAVETAVINLLNRLLLVLILVEIMHTVVLSLRAHHLVAQPLLAVGLVAVIRKILFVLSSEESVSSTQLALLIAMIAVFVAALILVSRYDPAEP
jgi:uncharacterized membrane protein (DUF373 family)